MGVGGEIREDANLAWGGGGEEIRDDANLAWGGGERLETMLIWHSCWYVIIIRMNKIMKSCPKWRNLWHKWLILIVVNKYIVIETFQGLNIQKGTLQYGCMHVFHPPLTVESICPKLHLFLWLFQIFRNWHYFLFFSERFFIWNKKNSVKA